MPERKLPPKDKIRFLKPTLDGAAHWPGTWPEISVGVYPPPEESQILFFDDSGEVVAKLKYVHPCNAYLGELIISGPQKSVIQEKYSSKGVAEDPWLGDLIGIFPHVWSWVKRQAEGIQRVKHIYGVDHIEVKNPPRKEAYQWIPDPTQWGAFDLVFKPLEDDEDEDDDFFREEYYSRKR